jgi:lysophospholipase L1-like esterase
MQHGEFPNNLKAKVWWILIGTNDLARGTCSEEAVVLGILRIVEEVNYHRPNDVIVVQGILPRSNRGDGALVHRSSIHGLFERSHDKAYTAEAAKRQFLLWPSIVSINKQLELFCEKHERAVFFDAANLFIGTVGNEHYQSKTYQLLHDLMPDYRHPSDIGMRIMGDAIVKELNRIIFEDNEANDIEKGNVDNER